jgi:hypothetical protein
MNPSVKTFELIHYGTDSFDPTKFVNVSNRQWIKPLGGLWTSPVESEWGWKEWCEAEEFNTHKLTKSVRFNFTGMTITIDREADLQLLPWNGSSSFIRGIDFEKLVRNGIHAIHLTEQGQNETRFSSPFTLYGWDCESVLVMNPLGLTVIESTTILSVAPMTKRRGRILQPNDL